VYIQLHEVQFWLWKDLDTRKRVCEVILIVCVSSVERTRLGLVFSRVTITNYTSRSLVSSTGIGRYVTPNCSGLLSVLHHVLFLWVKRSWSFRELLPCRHGEVCQHYLHV